MNKTHRVFVSHLLKKVVTGEITVLSALSNFPKDYENDPSLDTCFCALTHFEADEDIRNRDSLYKDVQDEYLMFLAETLNSNEDIPINIINEYATYYKEVPNYRNDTVNNVIKRLLKPINTD